MTTAHADTATTNAQESSPRYAGWRVVLACYLAAVFCWGFGLYGHGVYLTELHRLHGWPTALISGAVTGFYLLTAALVVFVSDAITRLGPRLVMLIGACCFGSAVALLAVIAELWQLYLAYLLMAVGAASLHVGAITNVVGLWFDRQRGLALSLALNGASSGGILVTPVLVLAIAHYGFSNTIVGSSIVGSLGAVWSPASSSSLSHCTTPVSRMKNPESRAGESGMTQSVNGRLAYRSTRSCSWASTLSIR